jgi:hypothetical protein
MSLLHNMMCQCVFMVPQRSQDGSGGYRTKWAEGERFYAAIVRDSSTEARIAEAAGAVTMYTVTVPRSVQLAYHTVFKRLSDGKTFRITSDNSEMKTPMSATLDMAQSTAEGWRLTE